MLLPALRRESLQRGGESQSLDSLAAKGRAMSVNRVWQLVVWGALRRAFFAGLAVLLMPSLARAQLSYTTNNGAITITRFDCSDGSVSIPGTINGWPVVGIGDRAFAGCLGLTNVTLGSGVMELGASVFSGCTNLVTIKVHALNPVFSSVDGVLFDRHRTVLIQFPEGKDGSYAIPKTVTRLGAGSFAHCRRLSGIVIPYSVTTVEDGAFIGCTGFTNVALGSGVVGLGKNAFQGCTNLTSVTIPNSITSIADGVFLDCLSLTGVVIPAGVVSLGNRVFAGCAALTQLSIPHAVTSIGNAAFTGCARLTEIEVEALNPVFGSWEGVLFEKDRATLVRCPEGKAGSYSVPYSVRSIADGAFSNCRGLTNLALGSRVASIGNEAFAGCNGLTRVTIPDEVDTLGRGSFLGCTGLTNVAVGRKVAQIGEAAFSGCTNLARIEVQALNPDFSEVAGALFDKTRTTLLRCPEGKTGSYMLSRTVSGIAEGAFAGCQRLTAIVVDAANPTYSSLEGVLFNRQRATLLQCPAGKVGSYNVPKTVTAVGNGAFTDCTLLTAVYFQGDAPSVGVAPFVGAAELTVGFLAGTVGWGTSFGGRPTAPWLPQVLTDAASFGVHAGRFGFDVTWAAGKVVALEACADLANPVWSHVTDLTMTGGPVYFSDPQWTNHSARTYRLRWE